MQREFNEIWQKILKDIAVELHDEFDRNFERKAFFGKAWEKRKREGKGSLLLVTGKLRRSLKHNVTHNTIKWTSSEVYANIHNEGGDIVITSKMKGYFWHKYYEAIGHQTYDIKTRSVSNTKKNIRLSKEAEFYKSMALQKTGAIIKIPQRQFIGNAPEVDSAIEKIIHTNLKGIETLIKNQLKQRK